MRVVRFVWILFGLFTWITFPAGAEFSIDKATLKIDGTKGEKIEKDFYCYSDWNFQHVNLDLTNKFSWPENSENFSKFNAKASFKECKQLGLDLDYQWNERYRILAPEITYDFKFKPGLTIGLEYETENRDPVLDEDQKLKYRMEAGTIKMTLDKKNWSYDLKLARDRKVYPEDEIKNYTKNQLSQDLAWRIQTDLKLNFTYYETNGFYPNDTTISKDFWSSKAGINGEYRFNDRWQLISSFSVRERERGLAPYLDQQSLELKLKNKPRRGVTVDLRVSSAEIDYYSDIEYLEPDRSEAEEEDQKSRVENKAALECNWRLKDLHLELEAGLFQVSKDYCSSRVADYQREGIYTSLRWKPRKFGIELQIAPNGTLWRTNGFYQLKFEYYFD